MFEAVSNFFRDIRVNYDFRRYEREARKAHWQKADRKFSTDALEDRRHELAAGIHRDAREKFDADIQPLSNEVGNCKRVLAELEEKHALLTRDYRGELNELSEQKRRCSEEIDKFYEDLSECQESISKAHDNVSEAYDGLHRYKAEVDSWYAKSERSPWLLGNAGRTLPKHSLFGQSHGDLEWAKDRRDEAWEEVCDAKDERAALFAERDTIFVSLKKLKARRKEAAIKIKELEANRRRKFDLKKAGQTRQTVLSEIRRIEENLRTIKEELKVQQTRKEAFVEQERKARGVGDLDKKIASIKTSKKRFLEGFDKPNAVKKRRQTHRKEWMDQR